MILHNSDIASKFKATICIPFVFGWIFPSVIFIWPNGKYQLFGTSLIWTEVTMFLLSNDKIVVYVYYGNSQWFNQTLHVCVLCCMLYFIHIMCLNVCLPRTFALLHPFIGLFSRTAGTRKAEPFWILIEQEWWDSSGISWTICKPFALCSKHITTPAPHYSIFTDRMFFLPVCHPTNSDKALKADAYQEMKRKVESL